MISNIEQNSGGRTAPKSADENDFKAAVDLLSIYSETENDLEQLQNAANQEFLITISGLKRKYASLQEKLITTETALELISRKHPEWFVDKKTIKTPYGSVQLKNNPPKIVAENPELSVELIKREFDRNPQFDFEKFLHIEQTLNLEALAGLDDSELKKFRLRREQTDTFTVKSAKLDMGKAVKEAAAKEEKK